MRAGAQKVDRQCAGKVLLFGVLCLGLSILPVPVRAQSYEIDTVKPFGLLDVDGHVRVGHYFDERDQSSVSSGSAESQTSWEQEIYLRTRSFIYHPGFLNMVIGGGPVFVQQDFESVDEDRGIRDTLFNFESRLNFLDIKNYPFSLYFEQSHPSVTRGLAGRFIVQNRRYGFNAAIRELFSKSTGVNVRLLSSTAKGSGFGYSVDDETEQASFAMQTSYGKGGRISFNYDRTDLDSASGSPGLPIHESTQQNDLSELRLENRFGRDDQIDLFQSLSRQQRELANAVTSTLDNRRYLARLNWRYNEVTRSQFRYKYADLRQSGNNSRLHSASASLSRRLSENAFADAGLSRSRQEDDGFKSERTGIRGNASYRRNIGIGLLTLGATLGATRTDQESSASDIPVFDETIVLIGTNPVDLAQEFVVPGSVVARNVTNTQIYVEDSDYRLIRNGSVTSIQRLIGGNIADGETVLVDYRYETSGTSEFDTLTSSVVATLAFLENLDAFVRYNTSDTNVRSGELTNLNDRDRVEFGLNAHNQPLDGWALTGQYRFVDQDEDISPYISHYLGASLAKSFWGRLRLSVSAAITRSDYEFSDEDVDGRSYTLGLGASPFRRAYVNYLATYIDDQGGTIPRTQLRHQLNFQWVYRMMRVSLRGEFSEDEQGTSTRDFKRVTLEIVRNF